MEQDRGLVNEVAAEGYDAAERPFAFLGEGTATALVCETDPALREKLAGGLQALGYRLTAADTAKEALRAMRFHLFDVVVVNERFATGNPEANDLLLYLESLGMATRRRLFVVLLSTRARTMDNMAAFNRSVNLVLHPDSLDDAGRIIRQGIAEHQAFYHLFHEALQKTGKG